MEDKVNEIFTYLAHPVHDLFNNICERNPVDETSDVAEQFLEYTAFMEIWGCVTGQIYLSLNKIAVETVSLKLFSVDIAQMGDEEFYFEGVKELLNIITGNCKNSLKLAGFEFDASLPDKIETEAAKENLTFSNHKTRSYKCGDIIITLNIAYY